MLKYDVESFYEPRIADGTEIVVYTNQSPPDEYRAVHKSLLQSMRIRGKQKIILNTPEEVLRRSWWFVKDQNGSEENPQ